MLNASRTPEKRTTRRILWRRSWESLVGFLSSRQLKLALEAECVRKAQLDSTIDGRQGDEGDDSSISDRSTE